jgi:hypothetical protein
MIATLGFGRSASAHGRLVAFHDLRARGLQCELVGREVLEEGKADDDQDHRDEADAQDLEEDDCEDDVQQSEQ